MEDETSVRVALRWEFYTEKMIEENFLKCINSLLLDQSFT